MWVDKLARHCWIARAFSNNGALGYSVKTNQGLLNFNLLGHAEDHFEVVILLNPIQDTNLSSLLFFLSIKNSFNLLKGLQNLQKQV